VQRDLFLAQDATATGGAKDDMLKEFGKFFGGFVLIVGIAYAVAWAG